MLHPTVSRVLIARSGIGGLVTAFALQQAGLGVTVFERVSELQEVGAGLTLWANAIQALQQICLPELLPLKHQQQRSRKTNQDHDVR